MMTANESNAGLDSLGENGYLIIGGSNKCGTTSLFRYLSAHPAICASRIKEAYFFYSDPGGTGSEVLSRYQKIYPGRDGEKGIFVEATPTYLHGGASIAKVIANCLPTAKLVFLLRDPAERLVSFYKSQYGQLNSAVGRTEFKTLVNCVLKKEACETKISDQELAAFEQEFTMARYVDFLPGFLQSFDPHQVRIVFLDHLKRDPQSFMRSICDFVGIEGEFYDDYHFAPQNLSRHHRSASFRRLGSLINLGFEPFFNRWPNIRNQFRGIYNKFNTAPADVISIDPQALAEVSRYYDESLMSLRKFMNIHYSNQELPDWLSRS